MTGPCNATRERVAYKDMAEHSTTCEHCSCVLTLVHRVKRCCQYYDEPGEEEKCIYEITRTQELLSGMERVALSADFTKMD